VPNFQCRYHHWLADSCLFRRPCYNSTFQRIWSRLAKSLFRCRASSLLANRHRKLHRTHTRAYGFGLATDCQKFFGAQVSIVSPKHQNSLTRLALSSSK
jgi:hypothetical protein